jgi:hypothetical protein
VDDLQCCGYTGFLRHEITSLRKTKGEQGTPRLNEMKRPRAIDYRNGGKRSNQVFEFFYEPYCAEPKVADNEDK